jgi:hypothetical protein
VLSLPVMSVSMLVVPTGVKNLQVTANGGADSQIQMLELV